MAGVELAVGLKGGDFGVAGEADPWAQDDWGKGGFGKERECYNGEGAVYDSVTASVLCSVNDVGEGVG